MIWVRSSRSGKASQQDFIRVCGEILIANAFPKQVKYASRLRALCDVRY